MQMSKVDKTNNVVKETLPLETISLGQKSVVSSQVTTDRHSATECLKKVNKKHLATQRIATWNVCTLYQKGQLENVMQEMQRLEIDVIGLSEDGLTQAHLTNKDITLCGLVDKSMNMALVFFLTARAKNRTRVVWLFQIESFYSSQNLKRSMLI